MGAVLAFNHPIEVVTCTQEGCGIQFGVPEDVLDRRREDGAMFYCPNGHQRVFRESENARLKRELAAEKQRVADRQSWLEAEQARHRATKEQLTKAKKRAAAGVCPCCQRTFTNMARHMKTKHPDYPEAK